MTRTKLRIPRQPFRPVASSVHATLLVNTDWLMLDKGERGESGRGEERGWKRAKRTERRAACIKWTRKLGRTDGWMDTVDGKGCAQIAGQAIEGLK